MIDHQVWKFPLPMGFGVAEISVPEDSSFLAVAEQGGSPFIWARVDAKSAMCTKRVIVAGTGHSLSSGTFLAGRHVGTYMLAGGALVFHVFEESGPIW